MSLTAGYMRRIHTYQQVSAVRLLGESQAQGHVDVDVFNIWNTERVWNKIQFIKIKTGVLTGSGGQCLRSYSREVKGQTQKGYTSPWRLSLSQLFLDSERGHL